MTAVVVAPEVGALLGPEGLALAERVPADQGCAVCGREVAGVPVVHVVLVVDGSYRRLAWVHAWCAASAVVEVPGAADAARADGVALAFTALLVSYGSHVVPVLACETLRPVVTCDGPGSEHADVLVLGALADGAELVAGLGADPPRARPGWLVLVDDAHDPPLLVILDVRAERLGEGSLVLPDGWTAAAERVGGCVLYLGPAALADVGENPLARAAALRTAAAGGRLVAGVAGVRRIPNRLTTEA
ncbi:hypothetical protein [Embleya sp. NPDC005971]|uniref:hypothetical protein n=1 Tax=Embleya sp. NPDC005971 TaxID=3156724 RepID=UPI0033F19020